jgi:hypothetical protein
MIPGRRPTFFDSGGMAVPPLESQVCRPTVTLPVGRPGTGSCLRSQPCPECALSDHLDVMMIAKVPTGALVIYTDGGCDVNRKSRVTRTLRALIVRGLRLMTKSQPAGGSAFSGWLLGDVGGASKPEAELTSPLTSPPVTPGARGRGPKGEEGKKDGRGKGPFTKGKRRASSGPLFGQILGL